MGHASRNNGARFEHLITHTCIRLKIKGVAYIQKTPEPIRIISGKKRAQGIFSAVYEKKAQPDFTGTLKGGQSVVFEAKHTESTNITFDRVNDQQEKDLAHHDFLGAKTFILISFNLKHFYAVPFKEWQILKVTTKKKSVNQQDLADFEISTENGLLNFVD